MISVFNSKMYEIYEQLWFLLELTFNIYFILLFLHIDEIVFL